jgi:hypothetical protein
MTDDLETLFNETSFFVDNKVTYNFSLIERQLEKQKFTKLIFINKKNKFIIKIKNSDYFLNAIPIKDKFYSEKVTKTLCLLDDIKMIIKKIQKQIENPSHCKYCFCSSRKLICDKCLVFKTNMVSSNPECSKCNSTNIPIYCESECQTFRICVRCQRKVKKNKILSIISSFLS